MCVSHSLVNEEDPVHRCQVAQQVHGSVQVIQCGHLATHTVVETPRGVVVHEAVANPDSGLDALAHLHGHTHTHTDVSLRHVSPDHCCMRHLCFVGLVHMQGCGTLSATLVAHIVQ